MPLQKGTGSIEIRSNNLPALAFKADRLLADPARLATMRAKARRLAPPHAARDIAMTLLGVEPVGWATHRPRRPRLGTRACQKGPQSTSTT